MKKPEPLAGLVIRYDFLWSDEARRGRIEGAKDRPCAVVLASNKQGMAIVCPITHSPPSRASDAIEIPAEVSRRLGLDTDRSFIIITEANRVAWHDAGIRPARPDRWEYGYLPQKLTTRLAELITHLHHQRRLSVVRRDEDPIG